MSAKASIENKPLLSLPINLGLNDGTHCPPACLEVVKQHNHDGAFRHYSQSENEPLLQVIADKDGVGTDNIYLANGSGPILKQAVPHVIRTQIKSSFGRICRHLVTKNGFPIITPWFTYSKVPAKAAGLGLTVRLMPLGPENGWKLDPEEIRKEAKRQDGLVYIVNPNNPTGNVLITREDLEPLLSEFPRSIFWIDEAYVQYVDPSVHSPVSDLVSKYPNLIVGRTFSFAYGLAGLRIGYLLGPVGLIAELRAQVPDYRLGKFQQEVAVAALTDPNHEEMIRRYCAEQRTMVQESLADIAGLEMFDSETNFLLARFTDDRKAAPFAANMLENGIKIKTFANLNEADYSQYFRFTLGTPDENRFLIQQVRALLAE